jgi:two-component system, chemotaxis family, chemotaxis protein CheY
VRTSKDSRNPFVPILIVTAHSTVDHVLAALNAGANDFLAKPLSPRVLYSRIADIIENPRSFVRADGYFGPCRRGRSTAYYEGEERHASGVKTIEI